MQNSIVDRFGNIVPEYYTGYFEKSGSTDLIEALGSNLKFTTDFLNGIPADKEDFAYAPGKWTVKEVMMHIIDVERIFAMRAMRFARNDKTILPGFDENLYVPFCEAQSRTLNSIINEYAAIRNSTIQLFINFNETMLERTGNANNVIISVETLGRVLIGHELHHIDIIKERYLA